MYFTVRYPRAWAVAGQGAVRRQGWPPRQGPQRGIAAAQAYGNAL